MTQIQVALVIARNEFCPHASQSWIGIAGFLSNLLIDYVIWKFELHRIVGNLFILSLSISDLIQGILVSIIFAVDLLSGDTAIFRGQTWCRFAAGSSLIAILSTVYNIVLVTLDRVIAIFMPFRYHEIMTEKKSKIIIVSLWIYMIIWCALPSFGWAQKTKCLRPLNSICDWGVTLEPTYFLITGVLVATSVLLVAILQLAMLAVAVRQMKAIRAQGHPHIQSVETTQGKVTRKVFFIVLAFAVAYLPWFSVVLRTVITGLGGQQYIYMCNCLIFLNSLLNPWIYAATDRTIRKRIKQCVYNLGRSKVEPLAPLQFGQENQPMRSSNATIFSIEEIKTKRPSV
ncbi:adenosine receptor A2a-like [Rhopilema esculentum]|uniref:adenosine receptor A2a-like n=1 Tax=Rhopilema esculentum TaxID=499914 RepID=UPI0031CDBB6B